MRKYFVLIPILVIALLLMPGLLRVHLIFQSPEDAFIDFMDTTEQAEDMLIDPLVLSGEKVVLIVLREIQNKEMKLRRYAIHFLGNGKYSEAIPALEAILKDKEEKDYFRADALASIYNIDNEKGEKLSLLYKSDNDFLGKQALEISTGENRWWVQRTYYEALRNVHH